MTTITASTTVGIDLNPATITSPVIIDAGVTVSNPGYPYAVYRHSGATQFFAIDNSGAIASGSSGIGVYLAPGGAVTNRTSASITGVKIAGGTGTVANYGSIGGLGVSLAAGGSVSNAADGSIAGIIISGGAGSVLNHGLVSGAVKAGSILNYGRITAYVSAPGGSVTNQTSAVIMGKVDGGNGTIVNYGTILNTIAVSGGGVANHGSAGAFDVTGPGGPVTNAASASLGTINLYIHAGDPTGITAVIAGLDPVMSGTDCACTGA